MTNTSMSHDRRAIDKYIAAVSAGQRVESVSLRCCSDRQLCIPRCSAANADATARLCYRETIRGSFQPSYE